MAFRDTLESGIQSGERGLLLDLANLSYMSSAGLRVLLMVARNFRGPDHALGVCSLSAAMHSVITLSGFDKIMPVYGTMADAIGAMSTEADTEAVSAEIRESRSQETVLEQLPSSVDMNTVGDNIADIAQFTIEKHEFTHDRLEAELREEALSSIKSTLWEFVERRMKRREEVLAQMFASAATTLDEVVQGKAGQ